MTDFSLNTEFENLIKTTLADQEQQKQQQQTEEIAMGQEKNIKNQQKAQISFTIIALLRRNFSLSLTQLRGSNRELFLSNFHTMVSIKKIFIIKTLYLAFTRF